MANDLPEPASRKEQFLAKAAGENVELPTPASREELYLNAIANNGGGGGGGDAGLFLVRASETTSKSQTPEGSDLQQYAGQTGLYINDQYTNISAQGAGNIYYVYSIGEDPETGDAYAEYSLIANQQELWATVGNISDMMPIGGGGAPDSSTPGLMGQLYIDVAGSSLYVCVDDSGPYVWQQLGGGGDAVYYNNDKKGISIGNNTISSTPASNGFSLFNGEISNNSSGIAMGFGNSKAVIGLSGRAANSIAIGGSSCVVQGHSNVIVGRNAYINPGVGNTDTYNLALGDSAYISGSSNNPIKYAVALGANSAPTRTGEVNVGVRYGGGYNNSNYRVLGGVHDGQLANDAVTVGQINALIDAINSATSSNISHIGS